MTLYYLFRMHGATALMSLSAGVAFYVIVALLLSSCGGAAQTAVSSQASVIVATRAARVEFYESEHARCLEASASMLDYDVCMSPARHVSRAVDSYREALFAAQAAVDAGNGGPAIGCAVEGARRLVAALEAANAPVPAEVSQIAALVPEGLCHE